MADLAILIRASEFLLRCSGELVLMEEKDFVRIGRAILRSEELSRRIEGWSSVEEIRRWRERR